MPSEFSLGDRCEVDGQVTIPVTGWIDINTMDQFEQSLGPYLCPPGLTLDFRAVTYVDYKGMLKLLKIQQDYQQCKLKLINVRPKLERKLNTLVRCGIPVEYRTEVA